MRGCFIQRAEEIFGNFEEFEATMAEISLRHHLKISHGIIMTFTQGVDVGRYGMGVYVVSLQRMLKSVVCPVEGFPERAQNL